MPSTMPARYGTERRKPKLAPRAVTLIVAGPGLPMTTSDARTRVASDRHRVGVSASSTIAFPVSLR